MITTPMSLNVESPGRTDLNKLFLVLSYEFRGNVTLIIIIVMAGMAVFNVAGYLIEERRRLPLIIASPRGQCSQ